MFLFFLVLVIVGCYEWTWLHGFVAILPIF